MINLMKADLYRIFRGKGFYIAFSVIIAWCAITVFVFRAAGVTIGLQEYQPAADYMTGIIAAWISLQNVAGMLYILFMVMFVMVVMSGFSSGAIKNELTTGIGRGKFYLSKFILSVFLCLFLQLFNFGVTVLLALPMDGMGEWGGSITYLVQSFALQSLIMVGLVSVGIFICFVTQKTAATIGLFLAFTFVPALVVSLMMVAFENAINFLNYDLTSQLSFFENISLLEDVQIIRGVIIGLIYIIVPTIAGIAIFVKGEVK